MAQPERLRILGALLAFFLLLPLVALAMQMVGDRPLPAPSPRMHLEPRVILPVPEPKVQVRYVMNSTAYNSLESQTDSTPHIAATGERTRFGMVALSRDMLELFPYGTTIEIVEIRDRPEKPGKCGWTLEEVRQIQTFPGHDPGQFRVSDTMHARKRNQLDMWLADYDEAMRWGLCEVVVAPVNQNPVLMAKGE